MDFEERLKELLKTKEFKEEIKKSADYCILKTRKLIYKSLNELSDKELIDEIRTASKELEGE